MSDRMAGLEYIVQHAWSITDFCSKTHAAFLYMAAEKHAPGYSPIRGVGRIQLLT